MLTYDDIFRARETRRRLASAATPAELFAHYLAGRVFWSDLTPEQRDQVREIEAATPSPPNTTNNVW